MKTSRIFDPRGLLAFALCSAGTVLAMFSFAATPPVGSSLPKAFVSEESAVTAKAIFTFATGVVYPAAITPRGVISADFNSDGKADIAVAGNGGDEISILLGRGDGTLQPEMRFKAVDAPGALAAGDLNGDGKLDLAVANEDFASFQPIGDVSILLGNGDGTFQPPRNFKSTSSTPNAIALGDFDKDGRLDVAVTNASSITEVQNLSVLLGNGDGTLKTAVGYTVENTPVSVAVADFNRDGNPDIITANSFTTDVTLLLGIGDGTFLAGVNFPAGTPASSATSVAVADLNGDGKADLVVGQIAGNNIEDALKNVSVLLGNGDGTFLPPVGYKADNGVYAVAIGDVSGDGKLDVVVANSYSDDVSVFFGNGDGTLQAPTHYPVGQEPRGVTTADLDGDGRTEIIASNWSSNGGGTASDVTVLRNKGNGSFIDIKNYHTGDIPFAVASGDFNKDGNADVAVANVLDITISVLLGNGDGTLRPAVNYPGVGGVYAVAVGDFNRDGNPDLAVANPFSDVTAVAIFSGNGDGTFQTAVTYPAGTGAAALAVSDFNADGKEDLAITNFYDMNISILRGKTDGSFDAPVNFGAGTNPTSIVATDFNRDGRIDLATANQGSNDISILFGSGNGTFGTAVQHEAGPMPNSISTADFNADNAPDLAVAQYGTAGGNGLSVFLGNDTGSVGAAVNYDLQGVNPFAVKAGDFDGDGKVDLVVTISERNSFVFVHGDGTGGFQPGVNYEAGSLPQAMAVADFNRDGKIDLAITEQLSDSVGIVLNSSPPQVPLTGVVSRKVHGSAGAFNINLPLTGSPGIECRSGGAGGNYTLVFTFTNTLASVTGASVTTGTGSVSSSNINGSDTHQYLVNLTGVTNAQVITVSLTNVSDSAGNFSRALSGSMGVLIGDSTGNRTVSNTDVSAVKAQISSPVTNSNFRTDVNANGIVSNTDVSDTKAQVSTSLP